MQSNFQVDGHQTSTCLCGRSFSQASTFTNHTRTCQRTKKRLSLALDKAKETWAARKRQRLDLDDSIPDKHCSAGLIPVALAITDMPSIVEVCHVLFELYYHCILILYCFEPTTDNPDDSHLSLVDRRPWNRRKDRRLPARFRDLVPRPLPALPPSNTSQPPSPLPCCTSQTPSQACFQVRSKYIWSISSISIQRNTLTRS